MKTILNTFRALPLAQKCVVVAELLALALLPFFVGMKPAHAQAYLGFPAPQCEVPSAGM